MSKGILLAACSRDSAQVLSACGINGGIVSSSPKSERKLYPEILTMYLTKAPGAFILYLCDGSCDNPCDGTGRNPREILALDFLKLSEEVEGALPGHA